MKIRRGVSGDPLLSDDLQLERIFLPEAVGSAGDDCPGALWPILAQLQNCQRVVRSIGSWGGTAWGCSYIGAAEDENIQEKGDIAHDLPSEPQRTQCSKAQCYRLRDRSQDIVDCHIAG